MNLIALVDKKWGIANKGRELVDIPEDKKLFREETYGKVVIMGRKTLEALPNQSALVGRKNIVLTRNKDYEAKDVCLCHSVEDVLDKVKNVDSKQEIAHNGFEKVKKYHTYDIRLTQMLEIAFGLK